MSGGDLPRTLKFATIWLVLGALVFVGYQWRAPRGAADELQRRRAASSRSGAAHDGHYHWPGTHQRPRVDFLVDTGASGTAIPARAGRASSACVGEGAVRSNTAGGSVTGRVVRADLELRGRRARRAPAHGRAAAPRRRRCSAWTCSAGCTGSSATACCASTSAPAREPVRAVTASAGSPRLRRAPSRAAVSRSLARRCVAGVARAGDAPPDRLPAGRRAARRRAASAAGLRDGAPTAASSGASSKGGRTSYLYGTIHVARPNGCFPGRASRSAPSRRATRSRSSSTCSTPAIARPPRRRRPGARRRARCPPRWPSASSGARGRVRRRRRAARLRARAAGRDARRAGGAPRRARPGVRDRPRARRRRARARQAGASRSRRPRRRSRRCACRRRERRSSSSPSSLDELEAAAPRAAASRLAERLGRRRPRRARETTSAGASCARQRRRPRRR